MRRWLPRKHPGPIWSVSQSCVAVNQPLFLPRTMTFFLLGISFLHFFLLACCLCSCSCTARVLSIVSSLATHATLFMSFLQKHFVKDSQSLHFYRRAIDFPGNGPATSNACQNGPMVGRRPVVLFSTNSTASRASVQV